MTLIIVIAIIAVIVFSIIGIYNNLVKLRNNRENAFADIDVQLKQRYDLVPQLVATVKGYAAHEKELLESITAARSAAASATSIDDKIKAPLPVFYYTEVGKLVNHYAYYVTQIERFVETSAYSCMYNKVRSVFHTIFS